MDGRKATIQLGYEHARWADERIFASAGALTSEEFLLSPQDGEPSVRDGLVHMLGWRIWWLAKLQGKRAPSTPKPGEFSTIERLRDAWRSADAARETALSNWNERALEEMLTYTAWDGSVATEPRWQALMHQVNHAVQHRSHLALKLAALGHSPGELDLINYVVETASNEPGSAEEPE